MPGKTFDLLRTPLEGVNLIEASAGTGKTYTITGLFLRLLLEKNLAVHQILVVTFTEAATEELRDRIRNRIREAVEAFSTGKSPHGFLEQMVKGYDGAEKAIAILREALRDFDKAAIFTIHGFCRRVLHENAFESGSLFDTELVADPSLMIQESVDDFWRRNLSTASPLFVSHAVEQGFNPDKLVSLLRRKINQPFLGIMPEQEEQDTAPQEKLYRKSFLRAREEWSAVKQEVIALLTSYEGFRKTVYGPLNVDLWIKEMEDFFVYGENTPMLFPNFKRFSRSEVQNTKNLKKGASPPEHPFFDVCEDLRHALETMESAFARRLLGLKVRMLKEVEEDWRRKKTEKNVQTFGDLLLNLEAALKGKGGEDLAAAVRRKYRAALIDEFQDTDSVQVEIFRSLFGEGGAALFLVGDPKQSIYGFRGADIFAYMEAAKHVDERYTLIENWRSDPGLIQSINALFSQGVPAFVYPEISFEPAEAAREKPAEPLRVEGEAASFHLWFIGVREWFNTDGVINKGVAWLRIPDLAADEILRLLNLGKQGKARVGGRALGANDIAVLVRRNHEALLMQRALSRRNIPSVLYSTENLFDTAEALETARFLAAAATPRDESLVRGALCSELVGMTGEELEEVMADEARWEKWMVKFGHYHTLWQEQGFIRMFRSFLQEEKVLVRLMALTDGERRNTNLLHLMEVLHRACVDRQLSMTGLLKWLREKRDPHAPRSEEHQLRLESDENAVNLVTIHKSKGLEYPIVFCPFSWDGIRTRRNQEPVVFHDLGNRVRTVLDLGSESEALHRSLAEKEELAENLRLLYVALTRSKCRVYLVWGRFKGAETSAPAYLLHGLRDEKTERGVEALAEDFKRLESRELLSRVKSVMRKPSAEVKVIEKPSMGEERFSPLPEETQIRRPAVFSGRIDGQWRISSFSSLVSDQPRVEEGIDDDGMASGGPEDPAALHEEPTGIFAFPKGARAGLFFHDLLEHLDFCEASALVRQDLVNRKLAQYGYEPSWTETVCNMLDSLLHVPLDPQGGEWCLAGVRCEDRLNELEFYYPLRVLTPEAVARILGRGDLDRVVPEKMELLHFSPLRGFMKGFMDMVFRVGDRYYLVDWKSNDLGPRVEDYGRDNLSKAMEENLYTLQYTLYTLALNRYLKLRVRGYDYDTHFGGVFYVFLRGVDKARGPAYGIYREKPGVDLIGALSEELMGTGAA